MAFGLLSTTALLTFGLAPANASAMVNTAEIFTTGASAVSLAIHKNFNRRLAIELSLAGSLGATIGAYVLSKLTQQRCARSLLPIYLCLGFRSC